MTGGEQVDLAALFAGMARDLLARHGVEATLEETCRLAAATIDGCDSAGVSMVHRDGHIDTPAASSEVAGIAHDIQYELHEGPCLDTIWEHDTVRIDDLATERRWPAFAAKAVEVGVGSMMCFRLFTERDTLGALNLFAARPRAFDEESREIGSIFAAHVAVALSAERTKAQLTEAFYTRQRIGEAAGILAERHQMTTADAFQMLAEASQHHNIKLRDLAERLVADENRARARGT
ncbi:GAF and ANTAR domain-containing protein [Actinocatenispora rupis]|uniref:Transcriptional regulator n=1 Tax=Actinocatenispora rupis TaxID=519421 RepID=A0A8J3NAI0_9ACTN|nr:GAF and ANTAR domain-containing protein [Actinocatenispora rupis]GID12394.1 transcriptional regulator [Actinocatenispora rupis]